MNNVKCSNRFCEKEYSMEFDKCPFCGMANPIEKNERKAMMEKAKAIEKNNSSNNGNQFNGIVTVLLWISIIAGGIRGFIDSLIYFTISPFAGCFSLGLLVFGIVALCYILAAKKWGIYAWVEYIVAVVLLDGSIDNNFLPYIFVGALKLIFLFLILQIRKNGVSAWSIIFNKKKFSEKAKESVSDAKINKKTVEESTFQTEIEDKYSVKFLNAAEKPNKIQSVIEEDFAGDIVSTQPIDSTQEVVPSNIAPSDEQSVENNAITEVDNSDKNPLQKTNNEEKQSKLKKGKLWIYPLIVFTTLAIAWVVVWLSRLTTSTNNYYEKWDDKQYTYSNYTYGFGWDLPKGYEWVRIDGQEKHTVFRAVGFPFVVFVNAQASADPYADLWEIYDKYVEMVEDLDVQFEKKTGQIIYERTFEKCTIMGHHAIRTTFKEYFKDSRYDVPSEMYAEEYTLIMNDYNMTIALKMPKEVYDAIDCSMAISEIFKGFRFAVKH